MAAIGKSSARRPGATTVVTPAVQQTAGQKAAISLIKAQPQANLTRLRVTADQMKDPAQAARVISSLEDFIDQSTVGARTNPLNGGGTLLKSLAFVGGTAKLVQHNLGRAPIGYFVTRVQSAVAAAASYGELFNASVNGVSLSIASGTFTQLTESQAGLHSGTTLTTGATGKITINTAGTYLVRFEAAISGTGNNYTAAAFINGVQQTNLTKNVAGTSGVLTSTGLSGLHTFAANDTVDVRFASSLAATDTLGVDTSNLSVASLSGGASFDLAETALPTGTDATQFLNLIPSATGTADVFVF